MNDELLGKPWAQAPWDLVTADISAVAFRILMAIQLHRRPEGKAPFPGQKKLAEMCHVSRPTVERAIRELRDAGYVEILQRPGQAGRRGTNSYTLRMPRRPSSVMDGPSIIRDGTEVEKTKSEVEKSSPTAGGPSLALVPSPGPDLTAYFVDESRRLGSDPPKRVIGHTAKEIKLLRDEGIDYERIRAGIDMMLLKRTHPSTLPSMVHEASLPARSTKLEQEHARTMEKFNRAAAKAREELGNA